MTALCLVPAYVLDKGAFGWASKVLLTFVL
jgi:hypothetical protein